MAKRKRDIALPPPYLKRVWLDPARVADAQKYPFDLPLLRGGFELGFDAAITIIVGENGTGKSTLLEAIAALSGFDQAGGGKGYMPTDHSGALETTGAPLATALRAAWLPKLPTAGFFAPRAFSPWRATSMRRPANS